MLKGIFSVIFISLVFSANAQKSNFSFELVELDRLYRGYPHLLKVQHAGSLKGDFTLIGKNLSIEEKAKGVYIITPGEEKMAKILVVQQKKNQVDTLEIKTYRVCPQPPSTLFLGNAASGTSLSEPSKLIFAKYSSDVPLNAVHKVLSWKLIYGNDVISGKGAMLNTEAENYMKKLPQGAYILLECIVGMQDQTKETIHGIWRKDYMNATNEK